MTSIEVDDGWFYFWTDALKILLGGLIAVGSATLQWCWGKAKDREFRRRALADENLRRLEVSYVDVIANLEFGERIINATASDGDIPDRLREALGRSKAQLLIFGVAEVHGKAGSAEHLLLACAAARRRWASAPSGLAGEVLRGAAKASLEEITPSMSLRKMHWLRPFERTSKPLLRTQMHRLDGNSPARTQVRQGRAPLSCGHLSARCGEMSKAATFIEISAPML